MYPDHTNTILLRHNIVLQTNIIILCFDGASLMGDSRATGLVD